MQAYFTLIACKFGISVTLFTYYYMLVWHFQVLKVLDKRYTHYSAYHPWVKAQKKVPNKLKQVLKKCILDKV